MTVYRLLGMINVILCMVDFWLLLRLVVQYEIPKVFNVFFYYMFVCVILTWAVQIYTVISPFNSNLLLKLSVTVFALMVMRFGEGIKHFSHKK